MSTSPTATPRAEYPRPQFDRSHSWLSCNGRWEFAATGSTLADPTTAAEPLWDRQIVVPFAWDCAASGVDLAWLSEGWYRRCVELPERWQASEERVVLHFGAVHHQATVWVNDRPVGSHVGGYLPFELDITNAVVERNDLEIIVRVNAPVDKREIVHGKQRSIPRDDYDDCAFAPSSGIWQSVWLELRPAVFIRELQLHPTAELSGLDVTIEFGGAITAGRLELSVLETGDRAVVELNGPRAEARIDFDAPRLWSPQDPYLYHVQAVLSTPTGRDKVTSYTGLRAVEVRGNELHLNGERLFVRGVLDQGYWPGSGITAPTDEAYVTDLRLAQEAGFNLVRKHLKTEDPRFLFHADRLGLLVWAEPACTGRFTAASTEAFEAQITPMVERDGNHPSIVIWGLYNEEWGLDWDVPSDPAKQAAVRRAYDRLKELDPSRPIVDNSGWTHVDTDLLDWHIYTNDPNEWRDIVEGVASGSLTHFPVHIAPGVVVHKSMMGTDAAPPFVPNLNSEYGGGFTSAQRGWNLRWQTQEIRRHDGLSGYVYTELYDIEHEMAGVYGHDRKPKELNGIDPALDHAETTLVLDVAPIEPGRDLLISGSTDLAVHVSHHGSASINGQLRAYWLPQMSPLTRSWAAELAAGDGPAPVAEIAVSAKPFQLSEVHTVTIRLPDQPRARLALIMAAERSLVAATTVDVEVEL